MTMSTNSTICLNPTKLVVVIKVRANAKSRHQRRQTIHNQFLNDEILLLIVGRFNTTVSWLTEQRYAEQRAWNGQASRTGTGVTPAGRRRRDTR
tara:strand:+ start:2536 stop:2817 length:282 start_codon:yes stop_codon:yes gene_type:complete